MNMTSRLGLISLSLVAVATLTACQSTATQHGKAEKQHQHGNPDGQYHKGQAHRGHHDRNMTPEQKQQWKQQSAGRKQLFKDMQQACDGKALGQSVQLKAGDQVVSGQCQMMFKPDQQAKAKYRDHGQQGRGDRNHGMQQSMQGQQHRQLNAEQRQQRQAQFEAKREQRQAQWTAVQKACEGQPQGKAMQVKMGEKDIKGQCSITFKPDLNTLKAALQPTVTQA